jgi:hypothetical protein
MKVLSMGMALVRQWFPEAVPEEGPDLRRRRPLAVELDGAVGVVRADGGRIEISVVGQIRPCAPTGSLRCDRDDDGHAWPRLTPDPTRGTSVNARVLSTGALGDATPFVWLQLFNGRGGSLTHQVFLGRGFGSAYQIHARIDVPTRVGPSPAERAGHHEPESHWTLSRTRLASGLRARIVVRNYRNVAGPQYQMEAFDLILLAAGAGLAAFAEAPVLALPRRDRPRRGVHVAPAR